MSAQPLPALDAPPERGDVLHHPWQADLCPPGTTVQTFDPANYAHPTFCVGVRTPRGWRFTDGTTGWPPDLHALVLEVPRPRRLRAVSA